MQVDYRTAYDLILALQEELAAQHHDAEIGCLDYKVVKALGATYELQDYLANRIAQATADGDTERELNPGDWEHCKYSGLYPGFQSYCFECEEKDKCFPGARP